MKVLLGLMASVLLIGSMQVSAKNYVIGVESLNYYPLYLGRGNTYTGYARELLDSFGKANGHTFTFKPLPVKRLLSEFLAGNLDFKYPANNKWAANAKKGHNISYSDSTVEYIDGLMTNKSNANLSVDKLKSIATLRGFTPWVYMDDIGRGSLKLSEIDTLKSLVSMGGSNRVQGIYVNVVVARYYMKNKLKTPDVLTFNSDLPHARDHFLLASIRHPEVVAELNDFLTNNKALVDGLKDKYQVRLSN
jgi:polar amino acid transport system substrate-binding protein